MTTIKIYKVKSQYSRKGLAREQQNSEELEDNEFRVKTIKDIKYLISFQLEKIVVDNHSLLKERNCIKVLKGFFYINLYNPTADIKLVKADLFKQYYFRELNNTINCF